MGRWIRRVLPFVELGGKLAFGIFYASVGGRYPARPGVLATAGAVPAPRKRHGAAPSPLV